MDYPIFNPTSIKADLAGKVLLAVLVLSLSAGCSLKTRINTVVQTTDKVNYDNGKAKAYPIVVRLYELRSKDAFESADFDPLYEKEQEILGADLIGRSELRFNPSEGRYIRRELNEETLYLGVIAAYREIDKVKWKKSIKLRPLRSNRMKITIGQQGISVSAN